MLGMFSSLRARDRSLRSCRDYKICLPALDTRGLTICFRGRQCENNYCRARAVQCVCDATVVKLV